LLANVYFRRFILAWKKFGWDHRTQSVIVNYADDCAPGNVRTR
jgi:RNA-directed DNA polymerase